jgi:putative tryptophan/tyrosine transport system substrate-binding protein
MNRNVGHAGLFHHPGIMLRKRRTGLSRGDPRGKPRRLARAILPRYLRGAKPGDLPVQSPTKYEMVMNLKTAKTLGLAVSPSILLRAYEVIE